MILLQTWRLRKNSTQCFTVNLRAGSSVKSICIILSFIKAVFAFHCLALISASEPPCWSVFMWHCLVTFSVLRHSVCRLCGTGWTCDGNNSFCISWAGAIHLSWNISWAFGLMKIRLCRVDDSPPIMAIAQEFHALFHCKSPCRSSVKSITLSSVL